VLAIFSTGHPEKEQHTQFAYFHDVNMKCSIKKRVIEPLYLYQLMQEASGILLYLLNTQSESHQL
jgi:hypothetical protein